VFHLFRSLSIIADGSFGFDLVNYFVFGAMVLSYKILSGSGVVGGRICTEGDRGPWAG
jgi:hypothetical protein